MADAAVLMLGSNEIIRSVDALREPVKDVFKIDGDPVNIDAWGPKLTSMTKEADRLRHVKKPLAAITKGDFALVLLHVAGLTSMLSSRDGEPSEYERAETLRTDSPLDFVRIQTLIATVAADIGLMAVEELDLFEEIKAAFNRGDDVRAEQLLKQQRAVDFLLNAIGSHSQLLYEMQQAIVKNDIRRMVGVIETGHFRITMELF